MKYEAGIVLAHELVRKGKILELSSQTKARTDRGIELLKENIVEHLIMSGGHGDFGEKYGKALSAAMKEYAIVQGAEASRILEEPFSLDTAGQLIFCRAIILEPRNWRRVLIISQKHHISRVKKIAEIILPGFSVDFSAVPDVDNSRTAEQEAKSIEAFEKTFQGVETTGKGLLTRLFEKHPVYASFPELKEKVLNFVKNNGI